MPDDLLEKAKAMQARYSTTERDKRTRGREKIKEMYPEAAAGIELLESVFGAVEGKVKVK